MARSSGLLLLNVVEQDRCPTTFSTSNSAFLLALSVLQTGDRKLLLNIANAIPKEDPAWLFWGD